MLHRDSTGFPLSVKPSHLFDSAEQMNTAEILAAIVEKACLFVPDVPVGVSNAKTPKRPIKESEFPKEAFSKDKSPKEEFSEVEKVPVASSNFVRLKCNCLIVCL